MCMIKHFYTLGKEVDCEKLIIRYISIAIAFVMCIGMMFGINVTTYAVNADCVYAGNYIKNWGIRGAEATFLSQNAKEFYADNNISYSELALCRVAVQKAAFPQANYIPYD